MTKHDPFRVDYCQTRGRHLVATEYLPIGRPVCFGFPIARALSTENVSIRCHNCWSLLQNPSRCASCLFARYCSVNCQTAAWSQHKDECRMIRRICIPRRVHPTPSLLALFHIVLRQPSDPLSDMTSNWNSVHNARRAEFMQMAVLLNNMLNAVQGFRHSHSLESLAQLFARHHSNSFTVTDGELQQIGIGIYPYPIYLLNHSCRPNAVVVFEQTTSRAVVVACRDINPNEEINIAYCDVVRDMKIRQQELLEQYYFTCSCLSCTRPEDISVLQSTVKLQTRFLEMLDLEDFEAAEQALSTIEAGKVYQWASIQRGLHYLKLGKLRLFLRRSGARDCLNRALKILCQLLVSNDPVLAEADQLFQEALLQ